MARGEAVPGAGASAVPGGRVDGVSVWRTRSAASTCDAGVTGTVAGAVAGAAVRSSAVLVEHEPNARAATSAATPTARRPV